MSMIDLLARQQFIHQMTDQLALLERESERIGDSDLAGELISSQIDLVLLVIEFLATSEVREKLDASSFTSGFEAGVKEAKKVIASRLSRCYDTGVSQVVLAVEVAPTGLEVKNGKA